ncbi:MAG: hypothetical protein HYT34_02145 [Candidatus Ryanbacteria bacterium]|nr:hypothetical protein [Candidatus Ryanbacteria bacterium]
MKNRVKYSLFAFVLFFAISTFIQAQEVPSLTPEQQLELRNTILDLFGLPHDTPLSIFDIMRGNTSGIKQPLPLQPLHDLELVLDRKDLTPGQGVRALLVTFSADLQKSNIVWYLNDRKVLEGKGRTSYSFSLGAIGSPSRLRAAVTTDKGITREIAKTTYPSRIHTEWYTLSYTPAWYRGKALAVPGSVVNVVALPDFRIGSSGLSPSQLLYDWTIDGETAQATGRGKNVFQLISAAATGVSYEVGVKIRDDSERIINEKMITIDFVPQKLLFYEKDPLYGVKKNQAIDKLTVKDGHDVVLQLEPFYVPLQRFARSIFRWSVNGQDLKNTGPNDLAIRFTADAGSSGTRVVSVTSQTADPFAPQYTGQAVIEVFKNE